MIFEDITFHPRFKPEEYEVLKTHSPDICEEFRDAQFALVSFPNGYSASILFGSMFYSNGINTYELGIMDERGLTYDTPITSDVLGYISQSELMDYLQQIENLPMKDIT